MSIFLTLLYEQTTTGDPIIREIVLGVIGTGIVGYLIRENKLLKERVKEVIDNHLSDMNKFREDKDANLQYFKSYQEDQNKFVKEIIDALNNTKKNDD